MRLKQVPRRRRSRLFRAARGVALLGLGLALLSAVQVALLRWIDPPTSTVMLLRSLELRSEGRESVLDHRWRPASQIAPALAISVVAAEDQGFPRHSGFDTASIRSAIETHRRGGRLRGGSTISQQVAKNLFLWSGRSWLRKGLEAWYTVLVEALWPKSRILEVYLNIAEFGDGIYGAEAAAQRFFGKPASRLDPAEAARLAAVLPSPRRLRADQPSAYVLQRQQWIEAQVRQLGGPAYLDRRP